MAESATFMQLTGWTAQQGRLAHLSAFFNQSDVSALTAMQARSGVIPCAAGTCFKVTQRGAGANMSVDVAAGNCVIQGTENALQGMYAGWSDATKNLPLIAADPTNPRIDLVVGRIRDSAYSGVTNSFTTEIVTGTAAASPVAPAMPASSVLLGTIAVAAAASSITNANITDSRQFTAARGGVIPGLAAAKPTFPEPYQMYFETDTQLMKVYIPALAAWHTIGVNTTMQTYTPTLTAAGGGLNLGASPTQNGRWCYIDVGVVWFEARVVWGGAGLAAGTGTYTISLPVTASALNASLEYQVGTDVHIRDISPNVARVGSGRIASLGTGAQMVFGDLNNTGNLVNNNTPQTWATGDSISIAGTYTV